MFKYKCMAGPHHPIFQRFFNHYRHSFHFDDIRAMDNDRNKALYSLAYLWCWERWGTGGNAIHEHTCVQLGAYVHDWMHNSVDGQILIHDDNHAFEFRMRWC